MALRTITFVRHGKTGKAANDLDRQLTEEGVKQAETRRVALGFPFFDAVLSSTADRAAETAAGVACVATVEVDRHPELYMPINEDDYQVVDKLFNELGYASLDAYIARDADVFKRYGAAAADVILAYDKDMIEDVLVCGHAMMLSAIANAVLEGLGFEASSVVSGCNLGECQGMRITVSDGTVLLLE